MGGRQGGDDNLPPPESAAPNSAKKDLFALLSQTKDNVRQYRQDLLVPTDQVDLYYDMRNVECEVTHTQVNVKIHVPVKGMNDKHVFVEFHPMYFRASPSDVCAFITEPVRVAFIGDTTVVVPPGACQDAFCDLNSETELEHIPACLRPLFPGRALPPLPCEPLCLFPRGGRVSHVSADVVRQCGAHDVSATPASAHLRACRH